MRDLDLPVVVRHAAFEAFDGAIDRGAVDRQRHVRDELAQHAQDLGVLAGGFALAVAGREHRETPADEVDLRLGQALGAYFAGKVGC